MSSVSSSAAFYRFFRDRENGPGAQRAEGGDRPGTIVPNPAAADGAAQPADEAASAASRARTPPQVRARLDALIAGQVAAGRLTDDQGVALRQTFADGSTRHAAGTEPAAPATTAAGDLAPTSVRPPDADGSWNPGEVLATFIQNLQGDQAQGQRYGSDGAPSARGTGSRLLDFNT